MHRVVTVIVVFAMVVGSVPAAATLADGTPSSPEPGAAFAGVVGVQGAEVDSEVANRSLNQRLEAAKTNSSKASVVASESDQLEERLNELEAEKAELNAAYENGNISKGQYTARLAVLSAELRAIERRANRTANTADQLPPEALAEKGVNVSNVRGIAQQANRTGGGEVAEAAKQIAGEGVGNGLGKPANAGNSANATDRGNDKAGEGQGQGPPTDAGQPDNATDNKPTATGNESALGGGPPDAGNNQRVNETNGSENGQQGAPDRNNTGPPETTATNQTVTGSDNTTNGSENAPDSANNEEAGSSDKGNPNEDTNTTDTSSSVELTWDALWSTTPDSSAEQWNGLAGSDLGRVIWSAF